MFWACAVIGAACVPLNAWWKAEELEFALARLRREGALLRPEALGRRPRRRRRRSPTLEHVFVMDLDEPDGPARPGAELLDAGGSRRAARTSRSHEDDLLAILYTSGTTGKPKGATITHRQALANLQNMACLGAIAAAQGAARRRAPTSRPRTCSSCRCST